jgi:hypothetical protein
MPSPSSRKCNAFDVSEKGKQKTSKGEGRGFKLGYFINNKKRSLLYLTFECK